MRSPPPLADSSYQGNHDALRAAVFLEFVPQVDAGVLTLIDLSVGFEADAMLLDDGIHTNAEGDAFIAGAWADAILPPRF